MELLKLQIKNFLSISDVELVPGKINQIVGRNGQGKTSILKALEFAVKGSGDGSLVKFGEDTAEVVVELSDATTIKRRLQAHGKQSLSVTREGFTTQQPQTFLDGLFNEKFSNPLDFLEPKKRTDSILSAIDLKVSDETLSKELNVQLADLPPLEYGQHGLKVIDQAHAFYYARRAEANKDAATKKHRLETYQTDLASIEEPECKKTKTEVQAELDANLARTTAVEAELNRIRHEHDQAKKAGDRLDRYCKAVDEIDKAIAELQRQIGEQQARREQGMKFVEDAKKEVPTVLESDAEAMKTFQEIQVEREKIRGQLPMVELAESIAKQKAQVETLKEEHKQAEDHAKKLTWIVDSLHGPVKHKLMAQVEMPVKGLEYDAGHFLVDGVPLENMSGSSSIALALGIARRLAKKTKLICLDGAEALDEGTYATLRTEIEGDGYTYFLTKVGEPFPSETDKVVEMQGGKAVQR